MTNSYNELIAVRMRIQALLDETPDALEDPDELTALNLRVWASAYLRVTNEEAEAALLKIKREAVKQFVNNVVNSAGATLRAAPGAERFDTLGRAFWVEADNEGLAPK